MDGWVDEIQDQLGVIENTAERVANKYSLLIVSALSLLYLAITVQLANAKILWTDEFFTLYLARLGPRDLLRALLTGGDQHPPPFYLMHHLFASIFGEHAWALRLPSILGFLVMMLCVYLFVARRTSAPYGFIAMVMPTATLAYEYAYEARGYGPLLGFVALAILCWQQISYSRWRTTATLGMAAALLSAVSCHYYAVLLLPAIAVAEIVRCFRRKAWNPWVWLALCAPIILLVALFPVIRSSSGFASTFWAKAKLDEINVYYRNVVAFAVTPIGFALAAAGLYRIFRNHATRPPVECSRTIPIEEIVLAMVLAAAPLTTYLFGKIITGAFAWRYAIGGVVGITILFGYFCFKIFRGNVIAAWLIILATVGFSSLKSQVKLGSLVRERASLENIMSLLQSKSDGSQPLIIGDNKAFYAMSYYGPQTMKGRFTYLVDSERSVMYLHHDTSERSLWALNPWFGLNVKPYKPYIETHPEMLVWSGLDATWIWLPSALLDDGEKLTILARRGEGILFSASRGESGTNH